MKKFKPFLSFTLLIFLLEILSLILVTTPSFWTSNAYYANRATAALVLAWVCGTVFLCIKKGNVKKALTRLLKIGNLVTAGAILVFVLVFLLALNHPYQGDFSTNTTLYDNKNVLVIIPHQDDDINLVGGMIEQYVEGGSNVTVVFTTNGDRFGDFNVRSAEAIHALTALDVKQENIYFLCFGDQWMPQYNGEEELGHIYNSIDPDVLWTSRHGSTATYGSQCATPYLDLPYTRSNYVYSFQSIIQEKMPDTIFVIDYDSHTDHRATSLFFEESMGNILTLHPDYHPTVYKGFAYGTAWTAVADFYDSINLLSTVHPTEEIWAYASFGYDWAERERFPISSTNLNWVMMNNSIYRSFSHYRSQFAFEHTPQVLNGDKVFWERRTDSLLYGAEVFAGEEKTSLLTDFKLKDFDAIAPFKSQTFRYVPLQDNTVTIRTESEITINSICLYDNLDPAANILAGYIDFSDGSRIEFTELEPDGSGTSLTFPEKTISWMEIVAKEVEGETAGLAEVEAFYDIPGSQVVADTFLMAVDRDDNFVYDYLLHEANSVELSVNRFPDAAGLTEAEVSLSWESTGDNASCHWENNALTVTCGKGDTCTVTISDGVNSTTFTVSNPTDLEYAYLQALRFVDRTFFNIHALAYIYHQVFNPEPM